MQAKNNIYSSKILQVNYKAKENSFTVKC